jgi:hypothetical protein
VTAQAVGSRCCCCFCSCYDPGQGLLPPLLLLRLFLGSHSWCLLALPAQLDAAAVAHLTADASQQLLLLLHRSHTPGLHVLPLCPRLNLEVQPIPEAQCDAWAQQRGHSTPAGVQAEVVLLPQGGQHSLDLVQRKLVANACAGAATKGQPGQLVALLSLRGL